MAPPACGFKLHLSSFLFLFISGELEGSQFWHLITTYPTLLLQGSVFRAGKAILFLKELGWTDLEIKSLVFPYHAAILQVGQQLQFERSGFWLLAIGRCLAAIAGASWACHGLVLMVVDMMNGLP